MWPFRARLCCGLLFVFAEFAQSALPDKPDAAVFAPRNDVHASVLVGVHRGTEDELNALKTREGRS